MARGTGLFRLEHNRGPEDVQALIQRVYNYTQADPGLRRAFTSWTRHVLLPRALPDVDLSQADNLLEIKTMLTDHTRSWTHQWKMEGLAEGRAEGRTEGRQESALELLQSLLQHKFGLLPDWVSAHLNTADTGTLQTWALNVLDARRLEDVFKD